MIAVVVLAAGASSRLGRPKQLLPVAGRPLLEYALDAGDALDPDQLVLVLGHQAAEIAAALDLDGLTVVVNSGYEQGQSSSLRTGLLAVSPRMEAVLLLTGDQPLVTPEHLRAIVARHEAGGKPLIATDYGDYQGVPMLLARSVFSLAGAVRGDQGARALLKARPSAVALVASPSPEMALDVDTEEDYQRLLALIAARG